MWRIGFFLMAALAGCSFITPDPQPLAQAFPDKKCGAVARQRAADGASMGYDPALTMRIAHDSYAACMDMATRASLSGN
jgi:hypothetical protein